MGKLNQEQEAVLAQIDAIITMLERNKLSLDMFDNIELSFSPIKLLLTILKRFGVGYDEIVDWLANYIVYVTPIIEIAVKGILLAKLKSNIDCNLDPRIPQYLREEIGGCTTTPLFGLTGEGSGSENENERGIEVDLSTIDYYGMLNNSPMSDGGRFKYFGTSTYYKIKGISDQVFYKHADAMQYCVGQDVDNTLIEKHADIESIYELVRARDLNAFLWFIIHKAKFLNVSTLNSDECILKTIEGQDTNNSISVGQPFEQMDGSNKYAVMGLCIKYKSYGSNNGDLRENATPNSGKNVSDLDVGHAIQGMRENVNQNEYTIVPTTNIWNGCNWYVDRSRYFDFYNKKERNYDKEFALFRLSMKTMDGRNTNKMLFTIKPAPNVIVPKITIDPKIEKVEDKSKLNLNFEGDAPWNFHRVVFDVDGKKDFWGKYSVVVGDEEKKNGDEDNDYRIYRVLSPHDASGKNGDDTNIRLYVNKKTREYKLVPIGNQNIKTVLYECYPGFTVYEFNYDYIMGIQLFDATVITAQLIEGLANIRFGISVNKTTSDYQMRISEIVKKMLEEENYGSSDCFYTFSNEEYDRMQSESELKRAQLYPFQDIQNKATKVSSANDIMGLLSEIDNNASLEENVSTISRALTQASAKITEEALPEDKYALELDFITKGIELITSIFVEALLSPKLLMVFLVNQKIMGGENAKDWDLEYLLDAFLNVIMALVDELLEIIIQKLLEFVMEKIQDLLLAAARLLLLEQVEYYARLMAQMLKACMFKLPNNPNLASTLDYVDYADIDPNSEAPAKEC
jgi:uncharacterized protein YrzB (UPF0473 family)